MSIAREVQAKIGRTSVHEVEKRTEAKLKSKLSQFSDLIQRKRVGDFVTGVMASDVYTLNRMKKAGIPGFDILDLPDFDKKEWIKAEITVMLPGEQRRLPLHDVLSGFRGIVKGIDALFGPDEGYRDALVNFQREFPQIEAEMWPDGDSVVVRRKDPTGLTEPRRIRRPLFLKSRKDNWLSDDLPDNPMATQQYEEVETRPLTDREYGMLHNLRAKTVQGRKGLPIMGSARANYETLSDLGLVEVVRNNDMSPSQHRLGMREMVVLTDLGLEFIGVPKERQGKLRERLR